jgi:hypothetical protein
MKQRDLILYGDDGDGGVVETVLPFKWEICSACDGHGTSSAYLGAFTASEWHELDEQFQEDYMRGRLDRACEHCEGGRVRVADFSRMTKAQRKAWNAQRRADREVHEEEMMERRMLYGMEPGY